MPTTTCHIRRCNASDLSGLTQLLDESFKIQNPAKESLVRWKFFDNYHEGRTITYAALNEAGEFVSQYTNFPVAMRYGNSHLRGMICADMTTRTAFRGQGLISQLARRVYADVVQEDADLSVGFSNAEGIKVDQNASGYGYKIVGRFERYCAFLGYKAGTPYRLLPTPIFTEAVPESTDVGAECIFRFDKTRAYLAWRYLCKPNSDYQIYKLMHEGIFAGYVILREAATHAYIYDIIADNIDMPLVLAAIGNLLITRGKRIAVLYILANAYWREALKSWIAVPPRWGRQHYYLTVKLHSLPNDLRVAQPDSWRLMAGDIL